MKTTLHIQNLKCGGCANTIKNKLSHLDGVENIKIDTTTDSVAFSHENADTLNRAKDLLSKLGYPVIGDKNALTTKVKSYLSCAMGRMQ